MAGKRKAEEGKVRWKQAEAVKRQAEAEQQEARKVCRRQAEAGTRQAEAEQQEARKVRWRQAEQRQVRGRQGHEDLQSRGKKAGRYKQR
jgi:hypothetical protein